MIDPLKINVTAVAEVMSKAFAERHRILAVEVTDDEVVIASCEPYVQSWESNLEHVLRKRVRRVLTDPRAIARHTAEFYTMAGSVNRARGTERSESGAGVTNLEQMLELGSMKEPDANDQHIVNIVDWLLQYAFEQRASDIHIEPRRDVGKVRFRIDGVLHSVYELPQQVCAAVTSPMASASSASTGRPVRIRSIARLCPISRGSRTVPPSIRGTPQRRQNTPITALSSTTRRSHHSASSRPPATA